MELWQNIYMKKFWIFVVGFLIPVILSNNINNDYVSYSFIIWLVLAFWFIRGFWRFIFQPPGEDSWRFNGAEGPAFAFFHTTYHGGHSFDSSAGLRASWLKRKLKNAKGRKKKRWEKELESLSKNFDIDYEISSNKSVRRTAAKINREARKENQYGRLVDKLKCPHCEHTGKVWRKDNAKIEEKTKEAGIIGGVIGRKTVTEKNVTQMQCMNCNTKWYV